jgi:hypothetical protein
MHFSFTFLVLFHPFFPHSWRTNHPLHANLALGISFNGSAICKFKDFRDESFFKKSNTFTGQERYLTKSFYLFGSTHSDLVEFKPGTFVYPF